MDVATGIPEGKLYDDTLLWKQYTCQDHIWHLQRHNGDSEHTEVWKAMKSKRIGVNLGMAVMIGKKDLW